MRYRSLFLCQCSSLRQFGEGFLHGSVLTSWVPIRPSIDIGLTRIYVAGIAQGVSWQEIERVLEEKEPTGDTAPERRGAIEVVTFPSAP